MSVLNHLRSQTVPILRWRKSEETIFRLRFRDPVMERKAPRLHQFVIAQREAIIVRARAKGASRSASLTFGAGPVDGPPLFLTQLSEMLRLEMATRFSKDAVRDSAMSGVKDALDLGFSISQLVNGYTDTCQAIVALALEQDALIKVEDFHALDRCLDNAIARAVTGAESG